MADDHWIDLDAEETEAEAHAPKPRKVETPLRVIDRRFWARRGDDENGGHDDPASDTDSHRRIEREALQKDLEARDAKLREMTEAYLRLKDETERFRARTEREAERRLTAEKGEWLKGLLPVVDSFDRALQSLTKAGAADSDAYREGLEMIRNQFMKFLAQAGVERIEPKGEPFDPNMAEAVDAVPVENAAQDNVVLETLAAGYRLGETLLRPASVRVGRKK